MKKFVVILAVNLFVLSAADLAFAQNYKIRQTMTMNGQKMETTTYVRGQRKRTEGGGFMGMGGDVATVEQCDLKRDLKISDKKKMYAIDPFDDGSGETVPAKSGVQSPKQKVEKGGTVTITSNTTDTGERKQIFGMTARHVKTLMSMESSPDACMKGDMKMETDGWYVDLPEFSCPITFRPQMPQMGGDSSGGCRDKMIFKNTGAGKLGFPVTETRTMKMGDDGEMSFTQTLETLEFSKATLADTLFDIPAGYTLTDNEQSLYGKPDMAAMMRQMNNNSDDDSSTKSPKSDFDSTVKSKKPGTIRIGVLMPTNKTAENISTSDLRSDLISKLNSGNVEAVELNSMSDAQSFSCDYALSIDITKMKQSAASKIGGMFGKATGVDTSGGQKYEAQIDYRLTSADGSQTILQNQVTKKDSGSADSIAEAALGQAVSAILGAANQKK